MSPLGSPNISSAAHDTEENPPLFELQPKEGDKPAAATIIEQEEKAMGSRDETEQEIDDWDDDFGDFEASRPPEAQDLDEVETNNDENTGVAGESSCPAGEEAFDRDKVLKRAVDALAQFQPVLRPASELEKLPKLSAMRQKYPDLMLSLVSNSGVEKCEAFKGSTVETRILQRLGLVVEPLAQFDAAKSPFTSSAQASASVVVYTNGSDTAMDLNPLEQPSVIDASQKENESQPSEVVCKSEIKLEEDLKASNKNADSDLLVSLSSPSSLMLDELYLGGGSRRGDSSEALHQGIASLVLMDNGSNESSFAAE